MRSAKEFHCGHDAQGWVYAPWDGSIARPILR